MLQKMGLALAVKGIGSLGKLSIVIQNFHSKNRKMNISQQNCFFAVQSSSSIITSESHGHGQGTSQHCKLMVIYTYIYIL